MTYIAIDLEMTGLKVKSDRILEIGALRMESGRPVGTFSALINPHCAVPEQITQLTGITQEMADTGEELSDVLPRFASFAEDLPLLGHNLSFDYSFLKQAFVNAGQPFERKGIDTLKLARRFLPPEQKKDLESLRTLFSIDTGAAHRAVSDACAAALIYERLLADYGACDPPASVSEGSDTGSRSVFAPRPMQMNIKKQQPVTIPQREQLMRLLSARASDSSQILPEIQSEPVDIDHLTRSEASRLIERLLRG